MCVIALSVLCYYYACLDFCFFGAACLFHLCIMGIDDKNLPLGRGRGQRRVWTYKKGLLQMTSFLMNIHKLILKNDNRLDDNTIIIPINKRQASNG